MRGVRAVRGESSSSLGLSRMTQEFLPLCDVLFNIISLASYFCNVVFDLVTVYTLFDKGRYEWFGVTLAFVLLSLLLCQAMSIKWYLQSDCPRRGECDVLLLVVVHAFQSAVLWRYFKLFVPVDLRFVKREVRDLCLLRLVHAFCEAAPMLLVQLYFVWQTGSAGELTHLSIVSTALSLFSICWALASFNKHVRRRNLHKLVLTWLGVIYQLLWRLGTVSSRMVTLTLYASLYRFWIFLVVGLHWFSMFLWLISPKNAFHGETISWPRKVLLSALVAYVYVFCYVNLHEVNARHKMTAFYVMMLLENTLLTVVWLKQKSADFWYQHVGVGIVWGGFALGMVFMVLYYRCFHVKRLSVSGRVGGTRGVASSPAALECTACQLGSCSEHSVRASSAYFPSEASVCDTVTTVTAASARKALTQQPRNDLGWGWFPEQAPRIAPSTLQTAVSYHSSFTTESVGWSKWVLGNGFDHNGIAYIPGVFNCRLNPGLKRKKKKPTTFVPPPIPQISVHTNGKVDIPFWKRPLPKAGKYVEAPTAGTGGVRVDIQEKLQAKKQQQLQELRVIEEEIKQGKLKRPHPEDIGEQGTLRQPIPRAKKQPWVQPPEVPHQLAFSNKYLHHQQQQPELLLAPHRLEARACHEHRWKYGPPSSHVHPAEDPVPHQHPRGIDASEKERQDLLYKSYRIPSDLDSQISLPRSYTLPREFKYQRKPKLRKTLRSEHFVTSTNSSDGDVDSGDDNDSDQRDTTGRLHHGHHHHHHHHPPSARLRIHPAYRHPGGHHETKL